MRIELLNIGTELLMGFVVNTHAAYLARSLGGLGLRIDRQICVNDQREDILAALRDGLASADVLVTTGGLGPTSDDITRDLVVELLSLDSAVDGNVLQGIEARFRRRGISMPESVKLQAVVPVGAVVFHNANGTAPGLAIPVSKVSPSFPGCRWLILLPGPPRELRPMWEEQVMPMLRRELSPDLPVVDCRVLRTVGMAESLVEEVVKPVLARHPGVEIGYCARVGEVEVRFVVRGKNGSKVQAEADLMERELREALGPVVFGIGETTLEQVVVKLLQSKHQTVTTAESCTGGFLAHRLTMVSGSSEVLRQGWITYANEAKESLLGVSGDLLRAHGAVSEAVARSMAEGARARAGADHALAVTGIAGPTGGTPEKPVGTVFVALATARETRVQQERWQLDRETFKFAATQIALDMLRRELMEHGGCS